MVWSLYKTNSENEDVFLPPLVFSNKKSQQDVVDEIISEIKKQTKVIFIRGVCGTGKSAIALNIAKELGKSSVVVPVKSLQKQYENDYTDKKYLLKDNGKRLNIKIITGRNNFECPFLKENYEISKKLETPLKESREKNLKLTSFYDETYEPSSNQKNSDENSFFDFSCDNPFIPCKIEIKEKNMHQIKEYLKQNQRINLKDFNSINEVKRLSIAPVCPYWSPIIPAEIKLRVLDDATQKNYNGLLNIEYTFHHRKQGCGFYDQYQSYINSDVMIFNSQKYILENLMNRKPATEIEIIDECDEFLDSFSSQKKINFNRLHSALFSVFAETSDSQEKINQILKLTSEIINDKSIENYISENKIFPLKQTKIFNIIEKFLDYKFMNSIECDEENYAYNVEETARVFESLLDETYVCFSKEDKNIVARLVTTNLEKRFKEILDKNKIFVMMSGTIHSEKVLQDIFGLKDFKIIEAETQTPGKVTELKTGMEINCRYSNFTTNKISRKQYLLALNKCIETAKKPILVHVNSFKDLPTIQEVAELNLNLMTREKLKQIQNSDKQNKTIKLFKKGFLKILYSTKCNRGIDFPGNTCNSIVLTKYPYPNISSLFWKILRLTKPEYYNEFYIDKAKREFLQRVYRGLRFQDDHIFLLSPDSRVFGHFNKK